MMHRHKRLKPIEYEGASVRETLVRMKTLSELMIDLAYSALLFSDKQLGDWVLELEDYVDELGYQLLMTLSLSVRDKHDAELAVGLFNVASAANRISDAAADLATLTYSEPSMPPLLKRVFENVEEHLVRVKIAESSELNGQKIEHVWAHDDISVDVIAVRRDGQWTLNPPSDFTLQFGDIVFARGSSHETGLFFEKATGIPLSSNSAVEEPSDIDRLALEMKEISEFMVSLAYASVVRYDSELAEDVGELEERIDELCELLIKQVLAMSEELDRRWAFIRLAVATEEIADAAYEMALVPLSGLETHSVLAQVVDESDEIVARIPVQAGSPLDRKTLAELALTDHYGLYIRSIKRSGHWFHRPKGEFQLAAGDILIVAGYRQGLEELRGHLGLTDTGPSENLS